MNGESLVLVGLAGILSSATPLLFAAIGETLAERAGVINLSLNGTILLSAMGSFGVAVKTGSLALGFLAGAVIGAFMALIVAFGSITLRQSQVAVGFVLAMVGRDLSYFLGAPLMGRPGPTVPSWPVPALGDIPVLGPLLFRHDLPTYAGFLLVAGAWFWLYRTRPGLILQGVGERPAAAHARGANVNRLRYLYTIFGGALVGLAGPIYSLSIKAGWMGTISGLDGLGWIALAITIFGGWNPWRAALGAWFFALLQWLGLVLQPHLPGVPMQVLQVAPFPLMILALLLVNAGNAEWVQRALAALSEPRRRAAARLLRSLRAAPPASLGEHFESR
ncbi:MAG TPA: ABC transporter permease [Kiritimatiellia bacterium]|nr:ABC transporter permease [Kiritimatiellia bacterium]HRZ12251.1 ABC transporter permease [Kiritimatiellia bacterium]HSA17991.1 ABC transporter permease [Kiritimatiellia bacterium]